MFCWQLLAHVWKIDILPTFTVLFLLPSQPLSVAGQLRAVHGVVWGDV